MIVFNKLINIMFWF